MPPNGNDKYAATAWGGELFEDLVVPSGQLCQVRRPGMQGLISRGILDKVDLLTSMVNDQHLSRVQGGKKVTDQDHLADVTSDPSKLLGLLDSVDRVAEYVVVQPALVRPVKSVDGKEVPLSDDERAEGVVYTDMVDLEDKMFIFNFAVGGTRDVARFREQSQAVMGGLDAVQDVAVPA